VSKVSTFPAWFQVPGVKQGSPISTHDYKDTLWLWLAQYSALLITGSAWSQWVRNSRLVFTLSWLYIVIISDIWGWICVH